MDGDSKKTLAEQHAAGEAGVEAFEVVRTDRDGLPLTIGGYRRCFDNCKPRQLDGYAPHVRAMLLTYSYASLDRAPARYVRGDTYLRAFKVPGINLKTELTSGVANRLADDFVVRTYGQGARRINRGTLDISPNNVTRAKPGAEVVEPIDPTEST